MKKVKPTTNKTSRSGRYPASFRDDAVRLATAKGASVKDVAQRLGVSVKSLYIWIRQSDETSDKPGSAQDIRDECTKLKAENKRLKMERDILKKSLGLFAREPS